MQRIIEREKSNLSFWSYSSRNSNENVEGTCIYLFIVGTYSILIGLRGVLIKRWFVHVCLLEFWQCSLLTWRAHGLEVLSSSFFNDDYRVL